MSKGQRIFNLACLDYLRESIASMVVSHDFSGPLACHINMMIISACPLWPWRPRGSLMMFMKVIEQRVDQMS
ncbi:hypothetical protein IEQ34_003587 [Dendrobium chrysotoxum]|uniref:Uncharacterized protein n=1 Tax=Dendrobium chrysotoxum TaxID=161865 RepID=A0AAV7H474_DENCH|nr:hypothetical protein IEQ34_003587 [Dendrobium chrysotoxum]